MSNRIFVVFVLVFVGEVSSSYVKNCRCGRSLENHLAPRIVGGSNLLPHEHPWLVAIFNNGYLHCGGTLINDRHVLTAGHCVKWAKISDLTVALGLHDLTSPEDGLTLKAKRIVLHGDFTSHLLHDNNDIALIELTQGVIFRHNIRPVCLPHPNSIHENGEAIVSGWGRLGVGKTISGLPLKVEVKVLNASFCFGSVIGEQFNDGMLCTYYEGRDSCQGDSGGPLVYKRNTGSYELIGIVSWGIGCGEKNIPAVYTKITKYLRWIERATTNALYCAINL